MKLRKIVAIAAAALMLFSILPISAMAADGDTHTVTFSKLTAGVQYASETHDLGNGVIMNIVECHLTSELRIYSSSTHNGNAIFSSDEPIKAIKVNAGNKVDTLNIFVSDDGSTWTKDTTISVTATSYKDYTATLSSPKNYVKIDVNGSNQVRLKSITFTFGPSTNVCEHKYDFECSQYCNICGKRSNPDAACSASGDLCQDSPCEFCGETVVGLGHTYDDQWDPNCNYCGEEREVEERPVFNNADLETITTSNNNGGDSGYGNKYTSALGWKTENCAIFVGGSSNSNPVFSFIGADNTTKAVCLNGKTTAVGKLTSPVLAGGISVLTFNYAHAFSESNGVNITITLTDANGNATTKDFVVEKINQNTAYEFEWELDAPITGDFKMEIVNNSPSNSESNKDRVAIWNIAWESASAECEHEYEHAYDTDCNLCEEPRDVTLPVVEDGQSASEDVTGLAFKFNVNVQDMAVNGTTAVYDNAKVGEYKLVGMGAIVSNVKSTKDVPAVYLCDLDTVNGVASFAVRVIKIPAGHFETEITATPYFVIEDAEGNQITIEGATQSGTYNAAYNAAQGE